MEMEETAEPTSVPIANEASSPAPDSPPPSDTVAGGSEGTAGEGGHHAETHQDPRGEGQDAPRQGLFDSPVIWLILGAVWLWALWSMRKNKRKQQQEQERQQELFRKGARIVTIGRLHGTIVSFDDKTVTIKPDEKRDLTLTFDRNAILHAAPEAQGSATDNSAT